MRDFVLMHVAGADGPQLRLAVDLAELEHQEDMAPGGRGPMARIRASLANGSAGTAGVQAKTSSIPVWERPCLPHLGQLPMSQSKPAIFMDRHYICLHKRNALQPEDAERGSRRIQKAST